MTARLSTMGTLSVARGSPQFDCVIVGSGFGASVLAARLAPHLPPGRLAVLERGAELLPGQFPETLPAAVQQVRSPTAPLGIFDFRFQRDMDSLVGNVLGGGSQLYAAVTLEPSPETFDIRSDPADATSPRAWPKSIDAETLRPYFDRVRGILDVERWVDTGSIGRIGDRFNPDLAGSWSYGCEDGVDHRTGEVLRDSAGREVRNRPPLRRTEAFDRAAAALRAPVRTVPIAVNVTRHHDVENRFGVPRSPCTGCGNCVTGCNVGAKNALTANYLPLAVAAGARIHTGVEVRYLRRSERGGYRWALLTRVRTADGGERHVVVHTNMVVLGAGVFGTAGILFSSRRRGLPVSARLGTRVSGNGDAIALAQRWTPSFGRSLPIDSVDEPGPTITRMVDLRDRVGHRHLVQDAVVPRALSSVIGGLVAYRTGAGARSIARAGSAALDSSLVMLAMGYDSSLGRLVERGGEMEVHWPAAGHDPVHRSSHDTMGAMADAMGSGFIANPRVGRLGHGTPITVHPLGGAPMGTGPDDGVVDEFGRLLHPDGGVVDGCYVVDGSVMPTALGANPSLTIAALAERTAELIVAVDLRRLIGEHR